MGPTSGGSGQTREEAQAAGTAATAGMQAGETVGGTIGLAAGGVTGWGVGMAGGAFVGLVVGMFLALAIVNTVNRQSS
jgi:hypothetical protein